jgi:transposase InsO family protein
MFALTKKNAVFQWTEEMQKNFDHINKILSSAPVLTYPDFDKEFHLFTDASCTGVGSVLCQQDQNGPFRPVSYSSRSLLPYEKNLGVSELEALAVVQAISRYEVYLKGTHFHLYSDHKALEYVFKGTKKLTPKLQRWALYLSQYHYTTHYRKGINMGAPDALSRVNIPNDDTTPESYENFPTKFNKLEAIYTEKVGEDIKAENTTAELYNNSDESELLQMIPTILKDQATWTEAPRTNCTQTVAETNSVATQTLIESNATEHEQIITDQSMIEEVSFLKCIALNEPTECIHNIQSNNEMTVSVVTRAQAKQAELQKIIDTESEQALLNTLPYNQNDIQNESFTPPNTFYGNRQYGKKLKRNLLFYQNKIPASKKYGNIETLLSMDNQTFKDCLFDIETTERMFPTIDQNDCCFTDIITNDEITAIKCDPTLSQRASDLFHKLIHNLCIIIRDECSENPNTQTCKRADKRMSHTLDRAFNFMTLLELYHNTLSTLKGYSLHVLLPPCKLKDQIEDWEFKIQNSYNALGSEMKAKYAPIKATAYPKRDKLTHHSLIKYSPTELLSDTWNDLTPEFIQQSQGRDPWCANLINYLQDGVLPKTAREQRICLLIEQDYVIVDDILMYINSTSDTDDYKLVLVVPRNLIYTVLHMVHFSPMTGHLGIRKTLDIVKKSFYWKGMNADVRKYVSRCNDCNVSKHGPLVKTSSTSFPLNDVVGARISIDFIGPLVRSRNNYRYICTLVENTSNHVTAFPLQNITAANFAKGLYRYYFCIYGVPTKIVSDRGSQFLSQIYQELAQIMNFRISLSVSYKPSTNGLCERANRSVINVLRAFVHDNQTSWCSSLQGVVYALNASPTFGQLSPFNIMFGRDATYGFISINEPEPRPMSEIVQQMLIAQKTGIQVANKIHKERNEAYKLQQEAKADTQLPTVGDVCYYKRKQITKPNTPTKFFANYIGPCIIVSIDASNNTAELKHLRTGQYFPNKVSLSQLKCPKELRSLPCYYTVPIPPEDVDTTENEQHLYANDKDAKILE